MTPLKFELLNISNFKRITRAELHINQDGLTILSGKNLQGKSSFLDACRTVIGGKKHLPSNPHHINGKEPASIKATLNNGLEVEVSSYNSTIKVMLDGTRTPQNTLKEFLNEFALDLTKFMHCTDTERKNLLLKHLGASDTLANLDQEIKDLFESRTIVGREKDKAEKVAKETPYNPDIATTEVDTSALMAQLQTLNEEQTEHAIYLTKKKDLEDQIALTTATLDKLKTELSELPVVNEPSGNTSTLQARIDGASEENKKIRDNLASKERADHAEAKTEEHQDLERALMEKRKERQAQVEALKMPIEHLSLTDGKLTYRDQEWDNMSGAQRILVSAAISHSLNPQCGFVLIDELEQFDTDTLNEVDTWAKSQSLQIIGTRVCDDSPDDPRYITIHDGAPVE